jgi:hypothetical protein
MTAAEPSNLGKNTPEQHEKMPVAATATEKAAAGDIKARPRNGLALPKVPPREI